VELAGWLSISACRLFAIGTLTFPTCDSCLSSKSGDGSAEAKGDLAELRVAADLAKHGCSISLPFGEDRDYDLIADFEGILHRVQVKYTESDGEVIVMNSQRVGVRDAGEYVDPAFSRDPRMEPAGFEPATFRMQTERSAS
jgi:hypothetical protein